MEHTQRMTRIARTIAAWMVTAAVSSGAIAADVEVLVLGTYHLNNPGKDVHNVEVGNVTTPERQAQLEAVAEALSAFAPTRVAVERVSEREDLSLADYESFEPAALKETRGESVQVGYRLAHRLGHAHVYGIDERDESIDYFPYGRVTDYAETEQRLDVVRRGDAMAAAYVRTVGRLHADSSIARALTWINQPALIDRMHRAFYYTLLALGDAERQPGALLNGRYYLRNARIFAKLDAVAEDGDRIVVVYGAGHAYWLRHFIEETPGWRLVEPNAYLAAALR